MAHIRLLVRNVRLEPNSTPRPLNLLLDPNCKENTTEIIIYMENKIPEIHFFGMNFWKKKSWEKDFISLFFPRAFLRIHASRTRTRKKSYWGRPSKSSLHVFCEAYPAARIANIFLGNYLAKKKSSSKNFTSQVFLGVFVWLPAAKGYQANQFLENPGRADLQHDYLDVFFCEYLCEEKSRDWDSNELFFAKSCGKGNWR